MPLNVPSRRSPGAHPPLQLALDAAGMGAWQWDAATDELLWDAGMYRIFGVPDGTLVDQQRWLDLIHPEDRARLATVRSDAMDGGGRFERRYRILRPDGELRWVEALGQAVEAPDGSRAGTTGCARDITEQMRSLDLLRSAAEEQERLSHLWQESADRTAALQRMTADLATALTVEDVATIVGTHLQRIVGAASGAVAIVDDDPRYLRLDAWFGYDEASVGAFRRHPRSAATPLSTAAQTGLPVYLQAYELADRYPALVEYNRREGSSSLAALPLLVGGQVLGGLLLGFGEPQPLDEAQRAFLELLASQAAQAVARSVLVARLRAITHDLQSSIKPRGVPHVPGLDVAAHYVPGGDDLEEVGGDWYDVFALPDGGAAFVVGDVMGRGVRASTAMSRYRAQLRAFVSIDAEPATVVGRLDRLVAARDSLSDWEDLLTLVYGVVDPVSRTVVFVNAGHPTPIVVRDEASVPLSVPAGPPVALVPGSAGLRDGVVPAAGRPTHTVQLAPGEVFLLYTDGLVERSWRDPDEGLALLVAGLERHGGNGSRDAAAVVTAAVSLDLGAGTKDDVTLLAIRCP